MTRHMKKFFAAAFILSSVVGAAQNVLQNAQIHGDFQTDFQYYLPDSSIGADTVPEKLLCNGYLNLMFTAGNFAAGVRYENYNNVMQGFDPRYKGSGIPYRFASYSHKDFEITVGNYYEQFGSGLLLRSYEERSLGIDNSLDGIRLRYKPYRGIYLKGVIGQQRFFFDKGEGIVRGLDGEINLNEFNTKWAASKLKATFGGSFVSKYQADRNPMYNLPENVGGWAARTTLNYGNWMLNGEYAYKVNDPSTVNNMIYKPGEALFASLSYSKKGFGITLSAKRIDNMNYLRSLFAREYLPLVDNDTDKAMIFFKKAYGVDDDTERYIREGIKDYPLFNNNID